MTYEFLQVSFSEKRTTGISYRSPAQDQRTKHLNDSKNKFPAAQVAPHSFLPTLLITSWEQRQDNPSMYVLQLLEAGLLQVSY